MRNSLGALLAIGLAGLQFLAVLAVVFSSYLSSERALIDHARELLRDVGHNTIEHSKGFLSPAQGAAELAARLAQNQVVASDNPAVLEQLLFQQLRLTPQFAGLYFGGENGDFVMVMRTADDISRYRSKMVTHDNGERTVRLVWRNDDFSIVNVQMDPADTFDPRTRPWYLKAEQDMATIWTDPYIFFSSQQPGITLAAPVRNDTGGIRGVIGVDIEISSISEFLSRLTIGKTGKALIINHNGDVIAHPQPELLKMRDADGTLRFADIREIDDATARQAFGPLWQTGDAGVSEYTDAQFVHDRRPYVATIMPIISQTLPWTIAVYAPEDDFTGEIKHNRFINIGLAVLVALVTALIGLALAWYIHGPVRAFAVRAALISQGELDPDTPAPKTYHELERANTALMQQIVARRRAEREYGQTFNMSSRGMAQITPDATRFLRVNDRFCDICGYSADELAALRLADIVRVDDDVGIITAECLEVADSDANLEARCIRKDGAEIWVAINSILIRDRHGVPLHAVLTMTDITEGKQAAVQIDQLNRDISHLSRGNTMGQMAAALAHELNQPLTAIAQNADTALLVLSDAAAPDPELRDILTEIEAQSLRAGEIIRALRSFIAKDAGAFQPFDLAALIQQTLALVRGELRESGVIVDLILDPDLPAVLGNRVQIAQVLVNLLHNAIEAMVASSTNRRDITLTARLRDDDVLVGVQDTGPGFPEGRATFAQFETTKPSGMGLGLSICRTIIEAHDGKIWVENRPGAGALFHFSLPLAPVPAPDDNSPAG